MTDLFSFIQRRKDRLNAEYHRVAEEVGKNAKRFYLECIKSDIRDSFSLLIIRNLKRGDIRAFMDGTKVFLLNVLDYLIVRFSFPEL